MGRSGSYGRALNGVLILNKDTGMSSNKALQIAKRLFRANKAGHTGSLDPLATGVLPICFGEATKFSQYLLDADKRYRSTFHLGATTDSADAHGAVLTTTDASGVNLDAIEKHLPKFRGAIAQVPPMVSALKHQGKRLYELAREGKEVERKARDVMIYAYELLRFTPGTQAQLEVDVRCSKGTYIRSLAYDLGDVLGVGGYVAKLHRSESGPFKEEQAVTLGQLEHELEQGGGESDVLDKYLLPTDAPIENLPKIALQQEKVASFLMGQAVLCSQSYHFDEQGGKVRVADQSGLFLGVAQLSDDGRLLPKRLIAQHQKNEGPSLT